MNMWLKISTILALFLLLGIVLWGFQDDRCLNSSVVRKINIMNSELYSCEVSRSRSKISLDPEFTRAFVKIERDIREFEIFKDQISNLSTPDQTITITLNKPYTYTNENNLITMGQDLFLNEGYFKRALVQAWLNQILSKHIKENKVLFEILSDNFMSLIWGDLELVDPILNKKIDLTSNANWLNDVLGEQTLCDSPWRPIDRLDLCEDLRENSFNNTVKIKYFNELSLWSLRPLVVKKFWSYYKNLSPVKRINFIQNWYEYIAHLDDSFEKFPIQIDLETLPIVTSYTIKKLYNNSVPPVELQLDLFVELKKQDFDPHDFWNLIKFAKNNPKVNILLRSENNLIILPSLQKMIVGYFHAHAKKQILISCKKPTFKEISNQKPKDDRLLFIEKCGPKELFLSSYENSKLDLDLAMKTFAEQNTDSNYMLFHIPSLKMAINLSKINANSSIEQFNTLSNDLELLGLNKVNSLGPHRIQAALPVVEWIRWNSSQKVQMRAQTVLTKITPK